ncbi:MULTISPECIES: acyl-CoA dehydrogenase family protein [unclassified Streptomyces]|uniref:acyl-CoA dehydrogenase family protein n=1 Tax=unclassified Streptomyces TaxID=2593676 RepID=UPI000DBA3D56|nr:MULTISPECIES: acyl-CoA dehydrogenase family protein [unclassified Streptomyces]MYT70289.1 acyl-CoA dehydrogenase [Streptomyces sp. SID8367]RAJ88865.1 alkylation response protein AidB-like acyl-CoA dehydrogenase [Streptomyces sp. PsTaAH-137]
MDFTPSPEQEAARELAARIFGDLSTPERLTGLDGGTDAGLWKALGDAGLAAAVEEAGLLGLVLMLEEQGRTTAQVPFAASCVYGLLAVAAHGTAEQRERLLPGLRDGSAVAAGAFPGRTGIMVSAPEGTAPEAGGGSSRAVLSGVVPWVPWLRDATHVLVAVREKVAHSLWMVRAADARCEPVELTAPWSAGRLVLDGTPAERIGGASAYEDVLAAARTAFAGLQAGVCAGSLARAVEYTNEREQFGRPLAAKQGVQLRAAEAHMDVEAMRVTAYEAAWRRDAGLGYRSHALTAAWWASEAGKRVVHTGQHLHGGLGADLDHPVHRHFLWGRQLDGYLGCGSEVLEELGELIAAGAHEGGESA